MLTQLTARRADGTFVGLVRGLPYHVVEGDQHWGAAQALAAEMGDALVLEQLPPPGPPPAPPPVSGRQFKAALALHGVITEDEMIAPELPAVALAALAQMTTEERIIAKATWPNLREVVGTEPLLMLFAAASQPPLGQPEIDAIMATARAIP